MKNSNYRLNHFVFWPPFLLLLAAVVLSLINNNSFSRVARSIYDWITLNFDWLFLLVGLIVVVVLSIVLFSKAGKLRFGGENAKSPYSFWNWFAMSLCGGIANGIVFWGVAEPITFLANPINGIEAFSSEAISFSLPQVFLHWSITPYCIYAIATIPVALAVYNFGKKLSISSGLYFLIGDKCDGAIGKVVNAVSLFALVGGIAASLGKGILQLGSGINMISGWEPGPMMWLILCVLILVSFVSSSVLGIDKGIKWLSDQNLKLYLAIIIFLFIVGPTTYILKLGVESMGIFATTFIEKSTFLGAATGEDWSRWWTVYYWAIWIAYAPVVGIFLTRLCYGRTIREFLVVNILIPSLFAIVWFTTFGATAFEMQLSGTFDIWSAMQNYGTESAVYAFFSHLPLGSVLIVVFLVAIFISFITMADSMTYVAAVLSTCDFDDSDKEPSSVLKLAWGIIMGAMALVMITFAGVDGAKMMATIAGFPLILVMIAFCLATIKGCYCPDKKWFDFSGKHSFHFIPKKH